MADLYLDPDTNDLEIVGGLRFTQGIETVTQAITLRMHAAKGEWFADLDNGIDYFGEIFGQKPDIPKVSAIFRKTLIETKGVDRVTSLIVTYAGATRTINVSWEVKAGAAYISGSLDL